MGFERRTSPASDLVVSLSHGQWLLELNESFELVWATTWGEKANDTFGSIFGLPRLPYIELVDLPRTGTRKLAPVSTFVGDRSVAWIDDELYEDADAWAAGRTAPTMLIRTAPYVGLTESHVDRLREFAAAAR
jgi:hypothetical protein